MTNRQLTLNEVNTLLETGSVLTARGKLTMKIPKRKEDAPEWKRHRGLAGVGISQKDAIKQYGLSKMNLHRWTAKGIIRVIGKSADDARVVLLDEQDVAYCRDIYRERGAPGRWLFTDTGAPYPLMPKRRKSDRK